MSLLSPAVPTYIQTDKQTDRQTRDIYIIYIKTLQYKKIRVFLRTRGQWEEDYSGPGAPSYSIYSGPGAPSYSIYSGPGAPPYSIYSGPGSPYSNYSTGNLIMYGLCPGKPEIKRKDEDYSYNKEEETPAQDKLFLGELFSTGN